MTRRREQDRSRGLTALISVHDVMPETRQHIERILQRLEAVPPTAIALLVVPGRAWTADDIDWLRALSASGYPLIGHGWRHECEPPRTLKHRLHSGLISNRAAEHFSCSEDGIARLMCDCHAWFREKELGEVDVYIPPAWALGKISRRRLASTPFRFVETLHGLYDTQAERWRHLPLAGFEVDRRWRAVAMRLVNRFNASLALHRQSPLRIAIHPHDWQYPLVDQLESLLGQVSHHQSYRETSSRLLTFPRT